MFGSRRIQAFENLFALLQAEAQIFSKPLNSSRVFQIFQGYSLFSYQGSVLRRFVQRTAYK